MASVQFVENYFKVGQDRFNPLEKTVDHCFITWTIYDLSTASELCKSIIISPPCQINSESWVIAVYPAFLDSQEKIIKFCLLHDETEDKLNTFLVTYRFGIKKNSTTWFNEQRRIPFGRNSCKSTNEGEDTIVISIPDYYDNISELEENELSVVCELYIIYDIAENYIRRYRPRKYHDLVDLSEELFKLCENSQESDITIRRKGFQDIPAHKFILSARSSVFARMIENKSSIDIPEEDFHHIRNLLKYIYSGNFMRIVAAGISIGLYECAQRYAIKGLMQILAPSEISISSVIRQDNVNFTWKIDNFSSRKKELYECITSSPFRGVSKSSPSWYLDIYPDEHNRALDNIGIYVRTKAFNKMSRVKCRISILDKHKQEHCVKCTFKSHPTFGYGFSDFITKKELISKRLLEGDNLIVHCKLLCSTLLHYFDKTCLVSQSSFLNGPCFEDLCSDMEKILLSGDYSDATVVGDSAFFPVHKAILRARSTVPALFVKTSDDEDCVIDMPGISSSVLKAFIMYAYTGKLRDTDKQSIVDLYSVGKRYNMISLVNLSFYVLKTSLDSKCICDAILLAFKSDDASLMLTCFLCLKKAKEEIFESMWWKTLTRINKCLGLRIEQLFQDNTA